MTALLAVLLVPSGNAQEFPSRPVRFMIPLAAGGGGDITVRAVSQKLNAVWGQSVVVDNRPGGTGAIALETVARAQPDGYTIVMISGTHTARRATHHGRLPYDLVRDFAPVSLVAVTPNILVTNPSIPVKTVKELIAYAKAKPGALNFPSAGVGSSSHLAGEMLKSMTGISMVHIPFKGGGPALVAVIAGEVQIMFATMPAAMPHVKSGKVKPVAVTTAKRSQAMPDLPTIAESGVKGYEASTWYGLLAPARTPQAIVTRLHGDTVKILAGPTRQRLEVQGFEPEGGTPAEFTAYIKSEIIKWAKVIKDAGIPAE